MKQGWITDSLGDQIHYVNDIIHNDDGYAILSIDNNKTWVSNGKLHRLDGPAIEDDEGFEWWYMGQPIGVSWNGYTQQDFDNWKRFRAFL